ncbi:MAG: DNA-binding protein [Sphingomonadales bacterium]|nr:MAG: DNA-binding protein [Sphingomonadales bacterium]
METNSLQGDSAPQASQQEFSTPEAADFLHCSQGHLVNLRQSGEGPHYQRRWKRKGIFYLRSDLEEWRRGRRYLSTSEY